MTYLRIKKYEVYKVKPEEGGKNFFLKSENRFIDNIVSYSGYLYRLNGRRCVQTLLYDYTGCS
jgi:hypothetical protein